MRTAGIDLQADASEDRERADREIRRLAAEALACVRATPTT